MGPSGPIFFMLTNRTLSQESLSHCVSQANEIGACYETQHGRSGSPIRSVDLLLETVSKYASKRVSLFKSSKSKDKTEIWGTTLAYSSHYEIVYVSGLDDSWTRMVVCKEVFQIILDEMKY